MHRCHLSSLLLVCAIALAPRLHAQWVTEQYSLKAGWNAVWLPHDVSHALIGNVFPVSVEEVWRWNPVASATQFTESPAVPVQPDTQWLVWKRGFPAQSTMTTLSPNAACLVKVADGTANFNHLVTGKAVPPHYSWKSSGLNFFGFPMQTPDSTALRNFETFLSHISALSAGPDIFKYDGGPITSNPVQVGAPLFEPVSRGRAYWIRSSQFTDYYGPLRVTIAGAGFAFGDTGTQLAMKIQNVTATPLTATLSPVATVVPPSGQTVSAGAVPLRLRGSLNPATGQFDYSNFVAATNLALAAGQEVEVVFAVNRAAMGGNAGDVFQSIVRVTDSLQISRIELPATAVTTSRAGLWVGTAMVTKVDQITAAPGPLLPNGQGTVSVNTDADASAPAAFPLRLIVHRTQSGAVKLLQQVYLGENAGGTAVVATTQSAIDSRKLSKARRFSSSTFPPDAKVIKTGADLGLTGIASFSVVLGHTAATNPFLHTFHPDHDNRDAQFNPGPLPEGIESFTVSRSIDLSFIADPAPLGLSDPGWGSTVLGGDYKEVITGLRAQPVTVKGKFVLHRLSAIGVLTE